MNRTHQTKTKAALIAYGLLGAWFTGWAQNDSAENQEVFELLPFIIDASQDEGYYASQTMAGGRLNQSLKKHRSGHPGHHQGVHGRPWSHRH